WRSALAFQRRRTSILLEWRRRNRCSSSLKRRRHERVIQTKEAVQEDRLSQARPTTGSLAGFSFYPQTLPISVGGRETKKQLPNRRADSDENDILNVGSRL